MAWTKGQIVEEAFGELALAGYVFDITPEETASALRRLDAMWAQMASRGVQAGYAFPATTDGSSSADTSGLPDAAIEATYTGLAVRLCAAFGKSAPPELLARAREGYELLLWQAAMPPEQQFDSRLARGAGAKPWRRIGRPFMPIPDTSPLTNTPGGDLSIQE